MVPRKLPSGQLLKSVWFLPCFLFVSVSFVVHSRCVPSCFLIVCPLLSCVFIFSIQKWNKLLAVCFRFGVVNRTEHSEHRDKKESTYYISSYTEAWDVCAAPGIGQSELVQGVDPCKDCDILAAEPIAKHRKKVKAVGGRTAGSGTAKDANAKKVARTSRSNGVEYFQCQVLRMIFCGWMIIHPWPNPTWGGGWTGTPSTGWVISHRVIIHLHLKELVQLPSSWPPACADISDFTSHESVQKRFQTGSGPGPSSRLKGSSSGVSKKASRAPF